MRTGSHGGAIATIAACTLALLATGCGERASAPATTQSNGPAPASTRLQALESTPQAREWLGQQAFAADARAFGHEAASLAPAERDRRARALEAQVDEREQAGEMSAGEAMLLRAGLVELDAGDRTEETARLAALAERYRKDAARREAAFAAQQAADPRMQRYKAREKAVVTEVMAMTTIPGGLTRDEYLRERLQHERELAFDGG